MADPLAGFDLYVQAQAPQEQPGEPWQQGQALVKCTAVWCGPCKRIAPMFLAYAARNEVSCFEVDVDADAAFSARFNVRLLPTFLLLQDGVEVDRVEGADWEKVQAMLSLWPRRDHA